MMPSNSNGTNPPPSDDRINANSLHFRNRHFPRSPDSASPAPSGGRRDSLFTANSVRTDSSSVEGRPFSLKSSTEDLLSPRATGDHVEQNVEASLWYSVPLLLAIVPAAGSLAFKGGSVFLTDLSLLVLTAIYLNWFLVTPWTWYQSARSIAVTKPRAADVAVEDAIEEEEEEDEEATVHKTPKPEDQPNGSGQKSTPKEPKEVKDAVTELHLHEFFALSLCFLGPVAGAYLLHVIRNSFSQIGHQMVSNLHLSLFVLGAEIRPMRHAIKLIHARTLFLQKIVRADALAAEPSDNSEGLQNLSRRLDELETSVADIPSKAASLAPSATTTDTSEHIRKIQGTLQTQVDALNRAVRRYEKRATAQTMQTEARLQDLEARLRDAISLAAVAANYSQKPGIFTLGFDVVGRLLFLPLKAAKNACMYPLLLLSKVTTDIMVLAGLTVDERRGGMGVSEKGTYYGKTAGVVRDNISLKKKSFE